MGISVEAKKELVEVMERAQRARQVVDAPSGKYPGLTLEDAYDVHFSLIDRKVREGARVIGMKIGVPGAAFAKAFPEAPAVFGHVLSTGVGLGDPVIPISELVAPRVEPEVTFFLDEELRGPNVTVAMVLAATKGVVASFEICDTRIRDWKFELRDIPADYSFHAGAVLGTTLHPVQGMDFRAMGAVMELNGKVVEMGVGAKLLGHPAQTVAWLANTLARYGKSIPKGSFILSGSFTTPTPAKKGDVFKATFSQIGEVTVSFA